MRPSRFILVTGTLLSLSCGTPSSGQVHAGIEDCTAGDSGSCECHDPEDASQECEPSDTTTPDTAAASRLVLANVSSNVHNPLSATAQITTIPDTEVQVQYEAEGQEKRLSSWSSPGIQHTIELLTLTPSTTYSIHVLTRGNGREAQLEATLSYETITLPASTPDWQVFVYEPERVQPGITFFGVGELLAAGEEAALDASTPLYVGINAEGIAVWIYQDEQDLEAQGQLNRDLKTLPDGQLLIRQKNGYRVIRRTGETTLQFSGGPAIGGPIHHDTIALPNGHFLLLSSEIREVEVPLLGGPVQLKGDRILERDTEGNISWQWNAFDALDPQRLPGPLSQTKNPKQGFYDWTHGNALVYREIDQSIWLSLRHQNWIVKIRHTPEKPAAGPDSVVWRFGPGGDFDLLSGSWFYSQHAPEPGPDGSVLVYDNGNERPGGDARYSRAVLYAIDEENRSAHQAWEYQTQQYTSFLGSARRLENGHILVCAGGVRVPGQPGTGGGGLGTARIVEVTQDLPALPVWAIEIPGAVYRAIRVSDF